ncbi:toprim domain-containing protein [Polaribacter sp. MSW13]|uniref:Toprim domain-containing protein n=1 Tax=Polaribacter marinus TaxID=2916838 RepID=A0A9X1VPJ7_9FLAO|nr:toprim domain-containing protein [Polaribacter marinus]MCI2228295.1 toprim domain-containing protein [Polaribacter marinus]
MSHNNIKDYLATKNIHPTKNYGTYGMYLSPLRDEKNASFKVDYQKDLFIDYGSGKGGNITVLSRLLTNVKTNAIRKSKTISVNLKNCIWNTQKLTDFHLLNYLIKRGISKKIMEKYCLEVDYGYYEKYPRKAVGFINDTDGYELNYNGSNHPKFKGTLLNKNITTFYKKNVKSVCVFEGFIDFLSFKTLYPEVTEMNFLILNSTSQLKKGIDFLKKHKTIYCFLDNDVEGNRTTNVILELFPDKSIDKRKIYNNYKDFNDYLIKIKP